MPTGGIGRRARAARDSTNPETRKEGRAGHCSRVVTRTSRGETVSTERMAPRKAPVGKGISIAALSEAVTSSAVRGLPSEKRTPSRKRKTHVCASGLVQPETSTGFTDRAESRRKSPSNTFENRSMVKASLIVGGFGKTPVTSARTTTVSVRGGAGAGGGGTRRQPAEDAMARSAPRPRAIRPVGLTVRHSAPRPGACQGGSGRAIESRCRTPRAAYSLADVAAPGLLASGVTLPRRSAT